jgi:transcriptional regulator with XRE-family HTH domain
MSDEYMIPRRFREIMGRDDIKQAGLAKRYGVSQGLISKLLNGEPIHVSTFKTILAECKKRTPKDYVNLVEAFIRDIHLRAGISAMPQNPETKAKKALDGCPERVQEHVTALILKANTLRQMADDIEAEAEQIRDESGGIIMAQEQLGYRKL